MNGKEKLMILWVLFLSIKKKKKKKWFHECQFYPSLAINHLNNYEICCKQNYTYKMLGGFVATETKSIFKGFYFILFF